MGKAADSTASVVKKEKISVADTKKTEISTTTASKGTSLVEKPVAVLDDKVNLALKSDYIAHPQVLLILPLKQTVESCNLFLIYI